MITPVDIQEAAACLSESGTGLQAMTGLLQWLNDAGLDLDRRNKEAVLTLIHGAWGSFPGSVREEMAAALERKGYACECSAGSR